MNDPILTVGLPMYKSKNIAWLAFESLCRQQNIDFDWELLVIEEQDAQPFGLDRVSEYKDRLASLRCVRFVYIPLAKWIPLSLKWIQLGTLSSPSSQFFLLQAADCYSQPFRLKETYDLFVQNVGTDWVHSSKGPFMNLQTGKVALYNGDRRKAKTHLNMATKTHWLRKLPKHSLKSGIDGWMQQCVFYIKKAPLKIVNNVSIHYSMGVDTSGANNISKSRASMVAAIAPPFYPMISELDLPVDIAERLRILRTKR